MITKIVSKSVLAAAVADEVASVCPAGTIGLVIKNEDLRRALAKELASRGLRAVYRAVLSTQTAPLPPKTAPERYNGDILQSSQTTLKRDNGDISQSSQTAHERYNGDISQSSQKALERDNGDISQSSQIAPERDSGDIFHSSQTAQKVRCGDIPLQKENPPFAEFVRFAVAEGSDGARAVAEEGCPARKVFLIADEILPEPYLTANEGRYPTLFFIKEEVEARKLRLAVSGVKTLLLFFLSAVDQCLVSVLDVAGEDSAPFRFLRAAGEFFCAPPVRQNYLVQLLALLREGSALFCPPFTRFVPFAHGTGERGVAFLYFMVVFLWRTARLPFLELLTLGVSPQQELYFLHECDEGFFEQIFGDDGVKKIARHLRMLLGKYALQDVAIERGYELLCGAVSENDRGFLSSLKKEGILGALVKYPL